MAEPLSLEQFKALRAKGLSVEQIVRFEKGETPGVTTEGTVPVPNGANERIANRKSMMADMVQDPSTLDRFKKHPLGTTLRTIGGAAELVQGIPASIALDLQAGKPQNIIGNLGKVLTGQKPAEYGDVFKEAGAPEPVAASMGLAIDVLAGGGTKTLAALGTKNAVTKVPTGIKQILKIEDDLQKAARAKGSLDTIRNTLGKAVNLSIQEAKDIPTTINIRQIKSPRVWNAIKNPVYQIEFDKSGALKQTVGNMNKVKEAVGDLLTPQVRNEAPKAELKHIRHVEGMISFEMKKAARKAGKPIHEQMAAYSNFKKKYDLVNSTLEDKKGVLLAERMKKTFEVGAEPIYKKAWEDVSKLSPEFKSVMKDQEKRVLLKRLLRRSAKIAVGTGIAGGAVAGVKAFID